MDFKVLLPLYSCLLGLNFIYCSILWFRSRESQYQIQSQAYFFFLITIILQGIASQHGYLAQALASSTVFFGLTAFTKLITTITKHDFPIMKYVMVYLGACLLTVIMYFLDVNTNLMTLPCLLGATYAMFSTTIKELRYPKNGLTFTTKCFLWTGLIYSAHMLDFAYAITRPHLFGYGFSLAILCILSFITFSNAAVMESILNENIRIKTLMHYKAMLTHSSKMASLGEMAGGVAHEINNPLAIIQLQSDALKRVLKSGKVDAENALKRVDAVTDSVQRIVKVITNLKYFSRDSVKDVVSDESVRDLIDQTLSFCKVRFQEYGVEILSDNIPDIKIHCRPGQFAQALLNIMNNAFEALANSSQKEKLIEIKVRLEDHHAVILVSDNGPGIASSIREKIFDPFFTTKDIGQGMGLGLSVSMGMIKAQNGILGLEPGDKTTFSIRLPVAN